ncbi:MAG: hypothetical protein P8M80_19205, partial [Pirellulaceae bacterium]|nr:hypothetical protein [Pirellulaceae bacterium]
PDHDSLTEKREGQPSAQKSKPAMKQVLQRWIQLLSGVSVNRAPKRQGKGAGYFVRVISLA